MLQTENRTRVICHLPYQNSQQEKAFSLILAFVKEQKDKKIGLTGYTCSRSFEGGWWSPGDHKWHADTLVYLMLDYKIEFHDEDNFLFGHIEELAKTIVRAYRRYHCPEEEYWIASERMVWYYFPSKLPKKSPARSAARIQADEG